MRDLSAPAVAAGAGFSHPNLPPTFLTLETAQYYMAKVLQPLFTRGYFEQLVIDRNRLYSQLLDNLNKAAVVGFSHRDISSRLKDAWIGKPDQLIHYDQAQECIDLFRTYCLENNLLDYSLQIEGFAQHLWPSHLVRQYLSNQYRHLIYENIEEDVPVAHDLVQEWMPSFDSALAYAGTCLFEGVNLNEGADPEDMISARLWVEQNKIVGVWLRPLRREVRRGHGAAADVTPADRRGYPGRVGAV